MGNGDPMDWAAWNERYGDPADGLQDRLAVVVAELSAALDEAPPGPLGLLSLCAGQGRDVLEVLARHPRGGEVAAVLLEADEPTVRRGRRRAAAAGLPVQFRCADASQTDTVADVVPADVVLACGVFGNVSDADVRRTVGLLPALCRPGGSVLWTRSRRPPDLVPAVDRWLLGAGFEQCSLTDPELAWSVGRYRFAGSPLPLPQGESMFTFVDRG